MTKPRFLVDAMLGSLARWLRILGFDAAYDSATEDADLVEIARGQSRVLLTRDRRLIQRRILRDTADSHLLIREDGIEHQLRQVIDELGLEVRASRLFGRCLRCNTELDTLPAAQAQEHVPPFVARTQNGFRRCPSCERIYWSATHVDAMVARLRSMGIEARSC